ncbi:MAG: transcriptional repressor [Lachnospiraceae bacterium]|nr:transcriptional repressor [Lachnospiraceae bacterium]
MIKHSKQRDSILAFLMTRKDHPTAEMVYQGVRDEFPNISLATVYRNLALLSEMGEIQKITASDGPDRFDADVRPHNHFSCRHCGCLIDLPMESISYIDDIAGRSFPGTIEGHSVLFTGLCPECAKQA